jgi:alkylation response protein AidB-like acyl-CoA dehydrogenase
MPHPASAWVTLENVKVPVENLIGQENKGFITLMSSMSTLPRTAVIFFELLLFNG